MIEKSESTQAAHRTLFTKVERHLVAIEGLTQALLRTGRQPQDYVASPIEISVHSAAEVAGFRLIFRTIIFHNVKVL